MHAGLRMMAVVGDAIDGGFEQRGDALFAVRISWRGWNPDDLRRLGFHQEHQIK
jgi:hypothetical protein